MEMNEDLRRRHIKECFTKAKLYFTSEDDNIRDMGLAFREYYDKIKFEKEFKPALKATMKDLLLIDLENGELYVLAIYNAYKYQLINNSQDLLRLYLSILKGYKNSLINYDKSRQGLIYNSQITCFVHIMMAQDEYIYDFIQKIYKILDIR